MTSFRGLIAPAIPGRQGAKAVAQGMALMEGVMGVRNGEGGRLHAGAARVDITPEPGIQLAGDIGRKRPVEEVRERLYASALVVEAGGRRACFLSVDILAMGCDWADRIRREAAGRFGMKPEAVMVHVVQNHAAPSVGHLFVVGERTRFPAAYPWLMGGDDRYNEPTVNQCIEAIGRAVESLDPVSLAVGHGIDGRVAFNRRFVMRDGTVRCHPPSCAPSILHVEGPTDPEVSVATFTNAGGRVVAALLHHTCHPCHGYPHRYVIGDWPGAWASMMRDHWGEDCVPLVVNGCCGNIHHTNHLSSEPPKGHLHMASLLAETTRRVLDSMAPVSADGVDVNRTVLRLPLRAVSDEDLEAAARLVARHPEPMWIDVEQTRVEWDWVYAVSLLDLEDARRANPEFPYEVQSFRIGDLRLLGLMGEPFVEGQLAIKRRAPTRHTLVAHFCNGYVGYVPTRQAFQGGGYETRTGSGSKLPPDAIERIVDAAVALLGDTT